MHDEGIKLIVLAKEFYLVCQILCIGGVVVEPDENDRLVAKPYNVAEANKLKQQEMENAEVQSLVTASMLAQQQKARQSNDGPTQTNYQFANSISGGNDISPSF